MWGIYAVSYTHLDVYKRQQLHDVMTDRLHHARKVDAAAVFILKYATVSRHHSYEMIIDKQEKIKQK